MQKTLSTKKGFTLIEIVIALAIAALIIVVVLLGVAGAQRSQRNDGRRAVTDRVRAAINDVRANKGTGVVNITQQDITNATANLVAAQGITMTIGAQDAVAQGGGQCAVDNVVHWQLNPDRAASCLEGTTNGTWYLSQ